MAKTSKREIGDEGEAEAVKYLENKGYKILKRNYLKKWGEIDIIAQRKGVLYFVEVKTHTSNFFINSSDWYRPEDNVHRRKTERIKRAIQSYLIEQETTPDSDWEFSVITVILKRKTRELYKLEHLENLII